MTGSFRSWGRVFWLVVAFGLGIATGLLVRATSSKGALVPQGFATLSTSATCNLAPEEKAPLLHLSIQYRSGFAKDPFLEEREAHHRESGLTQFTISGLPLSEGWRFILEETDIGAMGGPFYGPAGDRAKRWLQTLSAQERRDTILSSPYELRGAMDLKVKYLGPPKANIAPDLEIRMFDGDGSVLQDTIKTTC